MSPKSLKLAPTSFFVIVISPATSSSIVTLALLVTLPCSSVTAALTLVPEATTAPFSTVNVISVATRYPSGATTSCILYVPSGRLCNTVSFVPDLKEIFDEPPVASRSVWLVSVAPSPNVTLAAVNLKSLTSVRVISIEAPTTSEPETDFLLISTSGPFISFTKLKDISFFAVTDVSIVPVYFLLLFASTVAPEPSDGVQLLNT